MFAVTVTFRLSEGHASAFKGLVLENALLSKQNEPGCLQFDMCTDPDLPDIVFLYEIYTSKTAFEQHLATPHFKSFSAAVADMIQSKAAVTFSEVTQ